MYNYKNVDIMTQFIKLHNTPKVSYFGESNCFGHFVSLGFFLTRGFEHTGLGQD